MYYPSLLSDTIILWIYYHSKYYMAAEKDVSLSDLCLQKMCIEQHCNMHSVCITTSIDTKPTKYIVDPFLFNRYTLPKHDANL